LSRDAEKNRACPETGAPCPFLDEIRRLEERCRKLEAESRIDALTGFFNFRHLVLALEGEMERARRTGLTMGLILFDLDHFKQVNDAHGHEVGNAVLASTAELVRQTVRRVDICCRYGGEEFLIILPATRLDPTLKTAHRIQEAMATTPVAVGQQRIPVTASFGVDAFLPEERLTVNALIERVDRFVFQAKDEGRNRICHHGQAREAETEVTDAERKGLLFDKKQEKR
jgi:diguanylate cyclase (GGDEF)-like protein